MGQTVIGMFLLKVNLKNRAGNCPIYIMLNSKSHLQSRKLAESKDLTTIDVLTRHHYF
jgi:hypothetical protein